MKTREVQRRFLAWPVLLSMAVILVFGAAASNAQMVRERADIAKLLVLDKIDVANGAVSGEVVNRSSHPIRDVQLLIRYTWLWENETKPGTNDPGMSSYHTLTREIAPGGHASFTFKPSPPLPQRPDGRFDTSVAIAGFTEVIPQTN